MEEGQRTSEWFDVRRIQSAVAGFEMEEGVEEPGNAGASTNWKRRGTNFLWSLQGKIQPLSANTWMLA